MVHPFVLEENKWAVDGGMSRNVGDKQELLERGRKGERERDRERDREREINEKDR